MATLATLVRNTCRTPGANDNGTTFELTTTAEPAQKRALALIDSIRP
jgi:hypothetical protein